jgi:hypothetical protein
MRRATRRRRKPAASPWPQPAEATTGSAVSVEVLAAGQGRLCLDCLHYLATSWSEGHPTPCARVRWIGPRHHSPRLTRRQAGERCDNRQAQDGAVVRGGV